MNASSSPTGGEELDRLAGLANSGADAPGAPPRPEALPPPFSWRTYLAAGGIMAVLAWVFFRVQRAEGTGFFLPTLAALLGGVLVLAGPLVALSAYFATTFFGAIAVPGVPVSGGEALGLIVLAAWGLWIAAGRTAWPGGGFLWLLVGASVYFLLSALLGEDRQAGTQFAKYIVLYVLLGAVLLTSLRHPAHWKLWFWMVLLATTLNSLVGLFEFATGLNIQAGERWRVIPMRPMRIDGVSQNAIMFAFNNLWALGPGLYLALHERVAWRRGLAGCLVAFVAVMALLTFNRQTPIILFAMGGTGVLLLRHRAVRYVALAWVLALALLSPFLVAKMGERLFQVGHAVRDPSYALRRDKVRILLEITRAKPLTGVGLGSFPTVWPKYIPENLWFLQIIKHTKQYPDLGYVQMLGESGIIGLGLNLLILALGTGLLLRRRRRAIRCGNEAVANLCSVLVLLLVQLAFQQMIQDVFFFSRTWWLFAMIAVVVAYPDERLADPSPANTTDPAAEPPQGAVA